MGLNQWLSMIRKPERHKKIKSFLRLQSSALTVSEIHDALTTRINLKVSRKTIERDMDEMIELNLILLSSNNPARFVYTEDSEFDINLKKHELQMILNQVDPKSEIYFKLNNLMK